jgi:hypothetical protein
MQQHHIIGIVGLGLLNGLFSPMLSYALVLNALWLPAYIPIGPSFVFLFASLLVSTLSIMLAGVPAALYERFTAKTETTAVSALIWIGTLTVLTVPAFERMIAGRG